MYEVLHRDRSQTENLASGLIVHYKGLQNKGLHSVGKWSRGFQNFDQILDRKCQSGQITILDGTVVRLWSRVVSKLSGRLFERTEFVAFPL